ncbi:MAG: hypothetical protein ABIX28_08135, partial [Vicinamibacterales bacterium]
MVDQPEDPPAPLPEELPPGGTSPDPAVEPAPRRPRGRIRSTLHAIRLIIVVVVAIVVALCMTVFTIDLGPSLRKRAETEGTKFIERPMHIGRLSARLTPGVFVVENLVIEGLTPQDRPFLTAKTITVEVPWWTIFSKKLIVESVAMTDWHMVIETYANGRHNFPKFTRKTPSQGPSRFTTTLRSVVALRGGFTYEDHVTPWTTSGKNLAVQIYRPPVATNYIGRAGFSDGTVKIQSYEQFRLDMQSRFSIDNGIVHFDHLDLSSDGSRSAITGDVDMAHWPEQTYQVSSKIDFATQKGIFFHGQNFTASGQGDFNGTFHLFKGGRELKGTFTSPLAGVNAWRFPNLRGSVRWVPDRMEITNTTAGVYGGTAKFNYLMAPFGKPGVPTNATWDVEYKSVDLSRLTDFIETKGMRLTGSASGRNRLEWPLGKWAEKRGGGEVTIQAPAGVRTMTRQLDPTMIARVADLPVAAGPFNSHLSLGYLPVAGRIVYTLDP